jgi:hypothetical protein
VLDAAMSASGTSRTLGDVRLESAKWAKAELKNIDPDEAAHPAGRAGGEKNTRPARYLRAAVHPCSPDHSFVIPDIAVFDPPTAIKLVRNIAHRLTNPQTFGIGQTITELSEPSD